MNPLRGLGSGRGLAGCALVALVVLLGLLAPWLTAHGPDDQLPGALLLPPSAAHPLGTDDASRDVLSRTLHGIRFDLVLVLLAVPAGAALGCLLALAGLAAGWLDALVQRLLDVAFAFPGLILALAVATVVGPGRTAVVVAVIAAEAPVAGRVLRSRLLVVREADYVGAARLGGLGAVRTTTRHVLPNAVDPLVVQLPLAMASAVAIEGAMSVVGIGVRPPDPSLGSLLAEALRLLTTRPVMAVGPLVVLVTLVLGFTLVGEGLARGRRA